GAGEGAGCGRCVDSGERAVVEKAMRYLPRGLRWMMIGLFASGLARADGFRADRLLLTWQQDPTTTMTVQWVGSAAVLPPVEGSAVDAPVPRIPWVSRNEKGGTEAEWVGRLLALSYLANDKDERFPAEELDAEVRVGWTKEG